MKNKQLTNEDVFKIAEGLKELGGFKGTKFNYALIKNSNKVDATIRTIQGDLVKLISEEMNKVIVKVEAKREKLQGKESIELLDFLTEGETALYKEYNSIVNDVTSLNSDLEVYKFSADCIPEDLNTVQTIILYTYFLDEED